VLSSLSDGIAGEWTTASIVFFLVISDEKALAFDGGTVPVPLGYGPGPAAHYSVKGSGRQ
jgi:hypothetical protein